MRRFLILLGIIIYATGAVAQTADSANNQLKITGFADVYYGYHFNKPVKNPAPYGVFAMQHNQVALNLAYIRFSLNKDKFRLSLAPGLGTYMSANYAAEPKELRYIYEAYAGVKLSAKKKIWLEGGVLPSPYTNETAENTDHLTYTRSLGSEYSPYYLSGLRLLLPLNAKWTMTAWGVSGWQTIVNQGRKPALGLGLSGTDVKQWNLGFSAFVGNVNSPSVPYYNMRYFVEGNAARIFGKNELRFCMSSGLQQFSDTALKNATWFAGNIQYRYSLNSSHSIALRVDTYRDADAVVIQNITGNPFFNNVNFTVNYSYKIRPELFFRLEGRHYLSEENTFFNSDGMKDNKSSLLIASITIKI